MYGYDAILRVVTILAHMRILLLRHIRASGLCMHSHNKIIMVGR